MFDIFSLFMGWFTLITQICVTSKHLQQYTPNGRIRGTVLTAMNRRRG